MLEGKACTSCHCVKRVFGNDELDVDLVLESLCKTSEECTAAGKEDTVLDNVGIKFRRCVLKNMED